MPCSVIQFTEDPFIFHAPQTATHMFAAQQSDSVVNNSVMEDTIFERTLQDHII